MADLEIRDLHVSIDNQEVLKGIDLDVNIGEVHAVMGPNGSGKSTLAYALMGHPRYQVTKGTIKFKGQSVNELSADERAKLGLFLSFQYPQEVSGVTVSNFLRTAYCSVKKKVSVIEFQKLLKEKMALLKMDTSFTYRYLNEGFSGGEKKRAEILQLAVLEPSMAILDETDSGLDIDSIKIVANGVNQLAGKSMGAIVITHYQRILDYIRPDKVHVLVDGKIVASGGPELVQKLEKEGYDWAKTPAS